jgi:hypothetical protein
VPDIRPMPIFSVFCAISKSFCRFRFKDDMGLI